MKRNVMKNLWRFLAVLPLRVRGSQRELRTPPPSTDSRLSVVFICHLGFGIWNLFSIRPLTFGNCLPASVRQLPRLANIKGKPTKRIVRTLTTESSGGNRLTYEKGLLNSRKTAIFTKRIIPPSLILFPLSVPGASGEKTPPPPLPIADKVVAHQYPVSPAGDCRNYSLLTALMVS